MFIQAAMQAGTDFLSTGREKPLAIIGHFDTDGLCSSALLEQALQREKYLFSTFNYQHIEEVELVELAKKNHDVFLFVDIGAGKEELIRTQLAGKKIIILDHHNPSNNEKLQTSGDFVYINPHFFDIEQKNAISGAGVTYFFTMGLNSLNRSLAYLAVLGAIGDTQERNGFEELNNQILQHAIIQKSIAVGRRLRLYGVNSRPLVKLLEYSTDLDIPGVTNDPEGVRELLQNLGIRAELRNGRLKKYYHLHDDQKKRLTDRILDLKKDVPEEELIVPTYTLLNVYRRELKDLREYATVINACGRLGEYRIAIDALKGDELAQEQAIMQLRVYKTALREGLNLIDSLKNTPYSIERDDLVIFNLENHVPTSIVGILASILARNKHYDRGVVVCILARNKDGITSKISLRVSLDDTTQHLQDVLGKVVQPLGAIAGGHDNAAGAIIKTSDEENFIEGLQNVFDELKKQNSSE